jgi:hypothetical protein
MFFCRPHVARSARTSRAPLLSSVICVEPFRADLRRSDHHALRSLDLVASTGSDSWESVRAETFFSSFAHMFFSARASIATVCFRPVER